MKKTAKTLSHPRRQTLTRRPWLIVLILLSVTFVSLLLVKILTDISAPEPQASEKGNGTVQSVVKNTTVPTNTTSAKTTPKKESEKPQIVQNEGADPNASDTLSGTITFAQITGDRLQIRVSIAQYLSSGSCELSLHDDSGEIYKDYAPISPIASTSTCEGFDIPVSSLSGSSTYYININMISGEKSGKITGEVSI